jgi:hypothetical protein
MRRYGGWGRQNTEKSIWNIYMVLKMVFELRKIALNIEDISGLE